MLVLLVLLNSSIQEVNAFTTSIGQGTRVSSTWRIASTHKDEEVAATDIDTDDSFVEAEYDSAPQGLFDGEQDMMEPHPPRVPPIVDEQLERDLRESTRRIMLYEKEIEMVREQLDLKQDELLEERNVFRDEKAGLLNKIAEFTNILSQRDEELAAKNKVNADSQSKEKTLYNEIEDLKKKMDAITKSYQNEKKVTEALQKQYSDSQDALEFEQMSFQREKQELQNSIEEQKKALKDLETKLKQSEGTFDSTRRELEAQIAAGEKKLAETKAKWEQTQAELAKVEKDLRESLVQREKVLKESRETISQERGKFDTERKELKSKIAEEEKKVSEAQKELKSETTRFSATKWDLELSLKKEQEALLGLQNQLVQEQQKFDNEKVALQIKIKNESERLAKVETDLANERDTFSKEKAKLERKLSEEIRVGKLKKRVMSERYNEIRKEMTELWEGAKRDARKEEARLKKRYDKRIARIGEKVTGLETELFNSMKSNSNLRVRLAGLANDKEQLIVEKEALEIKYLDIVAQRDSSIKTLKTDLADLKLAVKEKELSMSKQDEKITKYENSFRQVAKLGVKVTGNKLKGAGRRLKRLVQNPPPPEE